MEESFEEYQLEKSLWTKSDFNEMGWHDSFIYALSIGENYELIFDIDYIFKWVQPIGDRKYFKFWVSPCTLVFENVYNLKFELEISEPFELEISDIQCQNPQKPRNSDYIKNENEYDWTIDTQQGQITFKSIGYKQFVRQQPILLDNQRIGLEDRKGISFKKQGTTNK